jgi:REP element-mobilizing transposase RayT
MENRAGQKAAPLQKRISEVSRPHGFDVMTYNPDIHHRRSIRLREFDYSSTGVYFITTCAQNRECLFGNILDGDMVLNDAGGLVESVWNGLMERFPTIELDAFVVMPNHVHFIVNIVGTAGKEGADQGGSQDRAGQGRAPTLDQIVGAFKSISAAQVNRLLSRTGQPLWQRNYYERVIRNESELHGLRDYIIHNPLKWKDDTENPKT